MGTTRPVCAYALLGGRAAIARSQSPIVWSLTVVGMAPALKDSVCAIQGTEEMPVRQVRLS